MNGESIFDVIIQGYSSLTRSETRVADYILKHKPELPYIMSKTLADACQVSENYHQVLPLCGLRQL